MKIPQLKIILFGTVIFALCPRPMSGEDIVGSEIAPWVPGMLDIHQISTGRGNAGLYIFPDGTSLLVDAGELPRKTARQTPDRPDGTRPAGEWIARYLRHTLARELHPTIDYALITHFHPDHMGGISGSQPQALHGDYSLTGMTWMGESFRIGKMLDRGWPDYAYPKAIADIATRNYRSFVRWQSAHNGMKAERFLPGRNDQIVLQRDPVKFPHFEVRNISANGEVWTGVGRETRQHFPALADVPPADWPNENMCSIAFRVSYGKFDYFSGGDLPGIPPEGYPLWHDVETPVAKAVGPVEAALLNHHGYIDSQNEFFVGSLRPRVWIISTWDSGHPTARVWQRLRSERVYSGPRDIFATDLHPGTRDVVMGIEKLASDRGHVVLRVAPGGGAYRVVIVDDASESHVVKKIFGPFPSR